ncbi:MAG: PDZ domain-containing protein, partial [Marinicella sp.]
QSITENSPLDKAGLKVGDHIIAINGQTINKPEDWNDISDALVANKVVHITYRRNHQSDQVKVKFKPQDKESHPNIETIYTQLTSDFGIRQRVIITKPKGVSGKQPAIMFLQGLSCSSVEINNRITPWTRLINEIVEGSDKVVLRVEKPGLGDSEGNCSQTDFKTELNGYEIAANMLKKLPYVDTDRITVYGNSMGSALAPYIANKFNFSAVISDGTFVKSWFEHMLEIERRISEFKGLSQAEITTKMNQSYIPLYYGMLIERKSYKEVIDQYPAIGPDNYHSPEHMYGRPVAYYQQLQQFDVAGAWQQLKVPARIRWGTNDWIMSESDNDMIIDILEAAGHQDHQLYKHEGMDHWQAIHTSAENSFNGEKGVWTDAISGVILDWLNEF